MIAASFTACGKKTATEDPTKVDENGSAYVEVTDKDGNTVTSVLSDEEKEAIDKKTTTTTTAGGKTTTMNSAQASEALSQMGEDLAGLENMDESNFQSDKNALAPTGTDTKKTSLRDDVIIKALKGGKYTLNMKLKAEAGDTPVTLVVKDKKMAADMTMPVSDSKADHFTVRMIIDGDSVYAVMPDYRMYFKISSDDIGSLDGLDSIASSDDSTYVKSTKVKIDGVEYTCEEYKSSDDTVMRYYFNSKNEWKRMELIAEDDVAVYEVSSFSNTADDSVFSLAGYADLSALLSQVDLSSATA